MPVAAPREQIESPLRRLKSRLGSLRNERLNWDPYWRDLARQFKPASAARLLSRHEVHRAMRNARNGTIDCTPLFSARTLASGLLAGISSPSRPWLKFIPEDEELLESAAVRAWLSFVEKKVLATLGKSNFYNVIPGVYAYLGIFGVADMMMQSHARDVIDCRQFPIGSFSLSQGEDQSVDTHFYEGEMSVRQMIQGFGIDNLSARVQTMAKRLQLEQMIDIVHVVEPNEDYDGSYVFAPKAQKKWKSVYFEVGVKDEKFLRQSGFDWFPIMAPRWERVGEDTYGQSPAMDVLGDAKQLQHQQKSKSKVIDKLADPPMAADSRLRNKKASLLPGDITYIDFTQAGKPMFMPVYEPQPTAVGMVREDVLDIQSRIKEGMFTDLFLMLSTLDRRTITAEEISRRYEEKVLMLDPVLTQTNKEFLSPCVDVCYNELIARGEIPPPPQELADQPFKADFIGVLAQAQRMVATQAITQLATFAGQMAMAQEQAGMQADALDKIDLDQSIDEYAKAVGAPAGMLRSDDDVTQKRQDRAKQQQQAMLAQAAKPAKDAATAAQTASQTPAPGGQGGSLLDKITGAQAQ